MKETKRTLSRSDFDKFRQRIEERSGIYIDDSKQNSFKISMDVRMDALGLDDYNVYYSLMLSGAGGKQEFNELLRLILIKETYFSRDERQLQVLTGKILPELAERKKGAEIKIWSAGCATGEEPYSIAMAIMESGFSGGAVSLYATDISEDALRKAQEGIYSKSSIRAIDRAILNKYFTQKDGLYYLDNQVKQRVLFSALNLNDPCYPMDKGSFDIIFCKNVIIYFRLETVKTVIQRFYDTLAAGGYLFVGHSESLWQISDDFELDEISGVFLYRKNGKSHVLPVTNRLPHKGRAEKATRNIGREAPHTVKRTDVQHSAYTDRAARKETLMPHKPGGLTRKKDSPVRAEKWTIPSEDNYDAVLEEIEATLLTDPENIDAHLLAGKIYTSLGLYDKALKKGIDALEVDDLSVDAYVLTGSVYYKTGEKEKAISAFKKAIYLDAGSIVSHYYLGNLYKDAKHIEQAVKEYNNVIRIFETKPECRARQVGEIFTAKQLKEICERNIEVLTSNQRKEDRGLLPLHAQKV